MTIVRFCFSDDAEERKREEEEDESAVIFFAMSESKSRCSER